VEQPSFPSLPFREGGRIDLTASRFRLGVLAVWLLACTILLAISWQRILEFSMPDADDYLRLQQVRDWLGGQSFFDVTQYRIDPPHGVPMHWSRIVDLPLAGLILLLKPLLGPMLAERVTVSIVPLLTLGATIGALALIGVRLADRRAALIAALLAGATPMLLFHVVPLRIDHHGWQTSCGLFTIAACFDPRPRRGGLIAGAGAALWLAISLEALPMVGAVAALLAVRFVAADGRDDAAWRLRAFLVALAITGALLFAGFHGRAAWSLYYCDAVSPAWSGPMVAAPLLAALLMPFARGRGPGARLGILLTAGAAGLLLIAATAPACLRGPFGTLDPLVRHFWYDNVPEGLPVWKQAPENMALLLGFPLVGMAGAAFGWRSASTASKARNWLAMLALMAAAFAVALLVQRAGAFAHGCALPGASLLLARLLDAIARWRRTLARVLASALAIVALSPVGAMMIGNIALSRNAAGAAQLSPPPRPCSARCDRYGALARLPRAYILAGIDVTPSLLVNTPHSFAGSAHHRDPQAIGRVLTAFLERPEAAHRIMAEHGMAYLLIDPDGGEAMIYRNARPDGLMANLLQGKAPAWLRPVAMPRSPLKLWRRVS